MATTRDFLEACFIMDWVDGTYLPFQLMPEEISEQKSINWQEQEIFGRSVPIRGYSSSGALSISLTLTFISNASGADGRVPDYNIPNVIRWFRSMAYPDYSKGFIAPPHPVFVSLGRIIQMKAVITDVQITHRGPWDFDGQYGRIIEVTLPLTEIATVPPGLHDIRKGSFMEGGPAKSGKAANHEGGLSVLGPTQARP